MRSPFTPLQVISSVYALISVLLPNVVWAQDRIYGPKIEKGAFEIEYAVSATQDKNPSKNGAYEQEWEIAYSPSDHIRFEAEGAYEREPQGPLKFKAHEIGFTYGMASGHDDGDDDGDDHVSGWALRTHYVLARTGEPDAIDAQLLTGTTVGNWAYRLNMGMEQGLQSGTKFRPDYSFALNGHLVSQSKFAPGFELQCALPAPHRGGADRQCYVGPYFSYRSLKALRVEAVLYKGLTPKAAQTSGRFMIEYETHF